jgi:hypothetical protein
LPPEMENPAVPGRAPKSDLAGASIGSESISPLRKLQASRLTRRCAISFAMPETSTTDTYPDLPDFLDRRSDQ